MEKTFRLDIISPLRIEYSNDVVHVKAPGISGYFGVLANHIPFLTLLTVGTIEIDVHGQHKILATSGGYSEVLNNKMTILAESIEGSREIDVERAQRARDRALKRLHEKHPDTDMERARAALMRALNRLQAALG